MLDRLKTGVKIILGIEDLRPDSDLADDPYELGENAKKRLRTLTQQDGWDDYVQILDRQAQFMAERILRADDVDQIHRWRGVVLGLRESVLLVDRILTEEDLTDEHRRRAERAADSRRQRTRLDQWGSGLYDQSGNNRR